MMKNSVRKLCKEKIRALEVSVLTLDAQKRARRSLYLRERKLGSTEEIPKN
jgi:hypothetical protein